MEKKTVNVPDFVYSYLAEFIKRGGTGETGIGNFSADVTALSHWETRHTGVEFMGDKESYKELVVDYYRVDSVVFWDENDEAVDTDFDMGKLARYMT